MSNYSAEGEKILLEKTELQIFRNQKARLKITPRPKVPDLKVGSEFSIKKLTPQHY